MMRRIGLWAGLLVLIGSLAYYMTIYSSMPLGVDRELGELKSINVWIYNQKLTTFLEQYEENNPDVNLNLRVFRSWEALYQELLTAISSNTAPHIAEIGSMYGVVQLANRGALNSVTDELPSELKHRIAKPFTAAFTYQDKLLAIPIGGSVPVLYRNENLFNSEKLLGATMTWEDLNRAGLSITKDIDQDGKIDRWGLVSDTNTSWYHLQECYVAKTGACNMELMLSSFQRWYKYLHVSEIMPPLEHQMALSEFIYGRAGMLLGSSQKLATLEKYIGGKFEFDVVPLPQSNESANFILDVSGLAVIKVDDGSDDITWPFVRYFLDDQTQLQLLQTASLIPSRADLVTQLLDSDTLTMRESAVLSMRDRFSIKYPSANDERLWKLSLSFQEWLETYPDIKNEDLQQRFREHSLSN